MGSAPSIFQTNQPAQLPEKLAPLDFTRRIGGGFAHKAGALNELLGRIAEIADLPLNRASTLPPQAYTSAEFFDWETEHLLRRDWQCVAHVSQIPHRGDFLNIDLLGEPLIVVHGKEGAVRVLSRVCPHRAMDIMADGFGSNAHGPAESRADSPRCGHTRLFLCPYHGWTFELDGKLKACPDMDQAEGFERNEVGLKAYPSAVWQGFIFVNLDGEAAPFSAGLEEMAASLAPYRLPEMKVVIAREWEGEFNWKLLVENFVESYHHFGIHDKTLRPSFPSRESSTEQERRRFIRVHLPRSSAAAAFPAIPALRREQRSEWGLHLLHPSTLLATMEDRVIWYRLQPIGPDRLRLLTAVLVSPGALGASDFEAIRAAQTESLDAFNREDMRVCSAVQRGLRSSGWQPGRLSHLEMPVWLFHRYIAARIRGVWPTEDREPAPAQRPAAAFAPQ
jgi:phenylpropionate dioxygenase-like ring-hydroxylating dioxygenase large terminal subunit